MGAMRAVYTLTLDKSTMKIKIEIPKLPDEREMLRLEEAVRVNAAECVMERVRKHFQARAKGGSRRRESYWGAAADAVSVRPGGAGKLLVTVDHVGVALHYYGSATPIKAKPPRRLLALPATPEMTEMARSVPGLKMVPLTGRGHLRGLLVQTQEATAKHKHKDKPAGRSIRRPVILPDGKLEVMYTLVDETRHRADPSVLPSDDELQKTALAAANEALSRMTND